MPTYIALGNYSQQGIRTIRESPNRLDAARQAVEAAGGSVQWFLTMGQYDFVFITEAPSDEAYASLMLTIASLGSVRTTSLRAFPEPEYRRIIEGLPSA
ncbi:MAG: GYD domain-containing protein [Dehalococcoidia bacterium]